MRHRASPPERKPMPQYKYSRDDYYRLTNAPCLDVARALGMEINEKESDRKSWKIKGEQGLCIYREGNGWYRFSDGRHGFPIETAYFYLYCDMVSHLKTFFFRKFLFRTLYGRNRVTTSLYLTPHRQRRCKILPGFAG